MFLHVRNMEMKIQAILILVATLAISSEACTWTFHGSCYNVVLSKKQFWPAEQHCKDVFGGHLIAITSELENDVMQARLIELDLNYRKYYFFNSTNFYDESDFPLQRTQLPFGLAVPSTAIVTFGLQERDGLILIGHLEHPIQMAILLIQYGILLLGSIGVGSGTMF